MTSLADLYQEIIMDHRKNPRNRGLPADHTHEADGFNPFCGDRIKIGLTIDDGAVREIGFDGEGCAISQASASIMTETVQGKSVEEAEAIFQAFRRLLTGGDVDGKIDELGDLEALEGVRAFPTRIKCAILAWHTLKSALEDESGTVTTE